MKKQKVLSIVLLSVMLLTTIITTVLIVNFGVTEILKIVDFEWDNRAGKRPYINVTESFVPWISSALICGIAAVTGCLASLANIKIALNSTVERISKVVLWFNIAIIILIIGLLSCLAVYVL